MRSYVLRILSAMVLGSCLLILAISLMLMSDGNTSSEGSSIFKYATTQFRIETLNREHISELVGSGHPFTVKGNSTYVIPGQKTCAVVGNSGILLNSGCGDEISSHEFVIRCNIPKIENYEQDVGNKTNITNVNLTRVKDIYGFAKNSSKSPTLLDNYQYLNNSLLWTFGAPRSARVKQLMYSANYLKSQFGLNFPIAVTEDTSTYLSIISSMKFKTKALTGGMMSIAVALSLCERVSVYGFYPFSTGPDGTPLPFHYSGQFFNLTAGTFQSRHNFNEEYTMLQNLNKHGILNFVTGKCT